MKVMRTGVTVALLLSAVPVYAAKIELSGNVEAGYRRDALDWNIADVDGSPNVLSELTWSSLQTLELKLQGTLKVEPFFVVGSVHYGNYYSGQNRDSDYLGDNRTGEFSRSVNDANGDTFGGTLGGGVRFLLSEMTSAQPELVLLPAVGLSYFEQRLNIFNAYQVIPSAFAGPFSGLYSEYDSQWSMVWLGIQLEATDQFARTFEAGVTLYPYGVFDAEANWNMRDEFAHPVSFRHHARAHGVGWNMGLRFPIHDQLDLTVRLEQRMLTTKAGRDITYLADGTSDETGLNDVNWDAFTLLRIGIEGRR